MASKLDIISAALILIGDKPLSSLSEDRVSAVVASNTYDQVYEDCLQSHRWRFAVGKATLAKLTATPVNEFSFAYQLPTDLLYMIRVYPHSDFEIFEDNLYSNTDGIEIDYTFKPDETDLPGYFVRALQYELAKEFSISVTNAMGYFDRMGDEAKRAWMKARYLDSSQRPSDQIVTNPFVDVRR